MFQYAAARTLADQLSCALIIAGHTHGRRFGFVGHLLGAASRYVAHGAVPVGRHRQQLFLVVERLAQRPAG
jgi:hypothetical protein